MVPKCVATLALLTATLVPTTSALLPPDFEVNDLTNFFMDDDFFAGMDNDVWGAIDNVLGDDFGAIVGNMDNLLNEVGEFGDTLLDAAQVAVTSQFNRMSSGTLAFKTMYQPCMVAKCAAETAKCFEDSTCTAILNEVASNAVNRDGDPNGGWRRRSRREGHGLACSTEELCYVGQWGQSKEVNGKRFCCRGGSISTSVVTTNGFTQTACACVGGGTGMVDNDYDENDRGYTEPPGYDSSSSNDMPRSYDNGDDDWMSLSDYDKWTRGLNDIGNLANTDDWAQALFSCVQNQQCGYEESAGSPSPSNGEVTHMPAPPPLQCFTREQTRQQCSPASVECKNSDDYTWRTSGRSRREGHSAFQCAMECGTAATACVANAGGSANAGDTARQLQACSTTATECVANCGVNTGMLDDVYDGNDRSYTEPPGYDSSSISTSMPGSNNGNAWVDEAWQGAITGAEQLSAMLGAMDLGTSAFRTMYQPCMVAKCAAETAKCFEDSTCTAILNEVASNAVNRDGDPNGGWRRRSRREGHGLACSTEELCYVGQWGQSKEVNGKRFCCRGGSISTSVVTTNGFTQTACACVGGGTGMVDNDYDENDRSYTEPPGYDSSSSNDMPRSYGNGDDDWMSLSDYAKWTRAMDEAAVIVRDYESNGRANSLLNCLQRNQCGLFQTSSGGDSHTGEEDAMSQSPPSSIGLEDGFASFITQLQNAGSPDVSGFANDYAPCLKDLCSAESVSCFNNPRCAQEMVTQIMGGFAHYETEQSFVNSIFNDEDAQRWMSCSIRVQCGAPQVCCGCTDRGDWKTDPYYSLSASPSSGIEGDVKAKSNAGAIAGGVIGGLVFLALIVFVVISMQGNSGNAKSRAFNNPPSRLAVENAAYEVGPVGTEPPALPPAALPQLPPAPAPAPAARPQLPPAPMPAPAALPQLPPAPAPLSAPPFADPFAETPTPSYGALPAAPVPVPLPTAPLPSVPIIAVPASVHDENPFAQTAQTEEQNSTDSLHRSLFASANPDSAGLLTAKDAGALLSTSGLPPTDLRNVWTSAKAAGPGFSPKNKMDLAEFMIAAQKAEEAGGTFATMPNASEA